MVTVFSNLDSTWANKVVGSTQGDGIVPLRSQNLYGYSGSQILGGRPSRTPVRDIANGQHTGDRGGVLKNPATRNIIRSYQAEYGLQRIR